MVDVQTSEGNAVHSSTLSPQYVAKGSLVCSALICCFAIRSNINAKTLVLSNDFKEASIWK